MTARRGRPPIAPELRRRGPGCVGVKFSAVEYAAIKAHADRCELSVPGLLWALVTLDVALAGRDSVHVAEPAASTVG